MALIRSAPLTFEELNRQACPYPAYLLPRGGTALALFAAGFHGWNDSIHFARKEMQTTCVDVDEMKLARMRAVYPSNWHFVTEDAWLYAGEAAYAKQEWDVVSVDPFLGDAAARAADTLALWTLLARQLVTLTASVDALPVESPEGWSHHYFPRSRNAVWMVMQRD